MPCRDHTSKALRCGTRSQGISQFYLHTLHTVMLWYDMEAWLDVWNFDTKSHKVISAGKSSRLDACSSCSTTVTQKTKQLCRWHTTSALLGCNDGNVTRQSVVDECDVRLGTNCIQPVLRRRRQTYVLSHVTQTSTSSLHHCNTSTPSFAEIQPALAVSLTRPEPGPTCMEHENKVWPSLQSLSPDYKQTKPLSSDFLALYKCCYYYYYGSSQRGLAASDNDQ